MLRSAQETFDDNRTKFMNFLNDNLNNDALWETGTSILEIIDEESESPRKLLQHLEILNAAIDDQDNIPALIEYAQNEAQGSPSLAMKLCGFGIFLLGAFITTLGSLVLASSFVSLFSGIFTLPGSLGIGLGSAGIGIGVSLMACGATMFGFGFQHGLSKSLSRFIGEYENKIQNSALEMADERSIINLNQSESLEPGTIRYALGVTQINGQNVLRCRMLVCPPNGEPTMILERKYRLSEKNINTLFEEIDGLFADYPVIEQHFNIFQKASASLEDKGGLFKHTISSAAYIECRARMKGGYFKYSLDTEKLYLMNMVMPVQSYFSKLSSK